MRRHFWAFPKGDHSEFFELSSHDLPRCTAKQRSYIYGLLNKAQLSDDDLVERINPYCESVKDFTPKEASEAIDYLKQLVWG